MHIASSIQKVVCQLLLVSKVGRIESRVNLMEIVGIYKVFNVKMPRQSK